MATHPEDAALFNGAMTSGAEERADDLLEVIDLSNVEVIVDVGGGQGLLATAIIRTDDRLRAIVADRPEVVASPADAVDAGRRSSFDGGSGLLASIPAGDAFVLSRILHDWPDDDAVAILTTCRRAMTEGARLYVLE